MSVLSDHAASLLHHYHCPSLAQLLISFLYMTEELPTSKEIAAADLLLPPAAYIIAATLHSHIKQFAVAGGDWTNIKEEYGS